MNAGGGIPIPELAALYEATQGLTYPGWEHDLKVVEDLWAQGWTTAESIERSVERMRRRQCLHEGDRSDAVLQVLDGATQGFTYSGWERDHKNEESRWVGGFVTAASIKLRVERMRRRQRLHDGDRSDALLQVLDEATQGLTYPGWEGDLEKEESLWAQGWTTAASIKRMVERMRRKQRLHDSRKLTDEEAEESARAYDEAQVVLQTVHDRNPAEPHDQNA